MHSHTSRSFMPPSTCQLVSGIGCNWLVFFGVAVWEAVCCYQRKRERFRSWLLYRSQPPTCLQHPGAPLLLPRPCSDPIRRRWKGKWVGVCPKDAASTPAAGPSLSTVGDWRTPWLRSETLRFVQLFTLILQI